MPHVSMLGHARPDTSGNVFRESYGVKATNDFFDGEVWVYDDTSTDLIVHGRFVVPSDWSSGATFKIYWTSTVTSGNVRWQVGYRAIAAGESMDQATAVETEEVTDAAPGTAHLLQVVDVGSPTDGNFAAGDVVEVRIVREGSDTTNDTMSGAAILFDARFEYTA